MVGFQGNGRISGKWSDFREMVGFPVNGRISRKVKINTNNNSILLVNDIKHYI